MSGLIRNFFTLILALASRDQLDPLSKIICYFRITPFDCGVSVLKSDKYLQLAESAQLDYLIKSKLLSKLRLKGLSFVNASQLVKFMKPVGVFKRVRVETEVIFTDDKCAYFSHSIFISKHKHAEVLVKMKFKKGALTVAPVEVFGEIGAKKIPYIQDWNEALEAMS
jgi:acyl-CoA thioesterase FadM